MSRIGKGDSYKHLPRKEKAVLEVIVAIAAGGTGLATVALAVITGYYKPADAYRCTKTQNCDLSAPIC